MTRTQKSDDEAETAALSGDTHLHRRGLNFVRRDTLKEQIYREIRHALQLGKFEPGEVITVKHLEEELGAGSMPIRESLQRLVAEGALVNLPNGRSQIPDFTADEFDEIKDIRLRLEGLAVHLAALRRSPEQMAAIRRTYAALNDVSRAPPRWQDVIERNYRFHFAIYDAANTSHLISIIDSLWLRVSPLLSIPARMSARALAEYVAMHDSNQARLVQAVEDGDGRGAEAAIREIILMSAAWFHRYNAFQSSEDGTGPNAKPAARRARRIRDA